jgi:hypothetical protein
MADSTQDVATKDRADWHTIAAALPGVAALGAALLYAAGLIARAGEVTAAGFSPQDVLPLIPLQQGLARGVALLTDPAVVLGFITFAGTWLVHLLPDSAEDLQRRHEFTGYLAEYGRAIKAATAEIAQSAPDAATVVETRLDRATRWLTIGSPQGRRNAKREFDRAAFDVRAAARQHGSSDAATVKEVERYLGNAKRPREAPWLRWLGLVILAVVCAYLVLTVDLERLPPYAVVLGAMLVSYIGTLFDRPPSGLTIRRLILVAVVLFMLGQAYLGAMPLKRVELRLPTGMTLRGDLIATPGTQQGTWYVSPKEDEVIAVQAAQPVTIRDSSEPGRFEDTSLLDLIRGK